MKIEPTMLVEGDEVCRAGMTPEQIESALRFLDTSQGNIIFSYKPLKKSYIEQIEFLLRVQQIMASYVMIVKSTETDEK